MEKYYIKFDNDKKITCEFICGIVQKLVGSIKNEDLLSKVLVMEFRNISNHDGDSPIPKIEFKN
jgi:hypothetical protein